MNSRLEETRAMYETGFLEETDVDQLQIAVLDDKSNPVHRHPTLQILAVEERLAARLDQLEKIYITQHPPSPQRRVR